MDIGDGDRFDAEVGVVDFDEIHVLWQGFALDEGGDAG